jgi:hypothetical protein
LANSSANHAAKSSTKSRKRTFRGLQYQKMAEGYKLLRSPVADSYHAAAEHYREVDPPIDPPHEEPHQG